MVIKLIRLSPEYIRADATPLPNSKGEETYRLELVKDNKKYRIAAEKIDFKNHSLCEKVVLVCKMLLSSLFSPYEKMEFSDGTYLVNKNSLCKRLGIARTNYDKLADSEKENIIVRKISLIGQDDHEVKAMIIYEKTTLKESNNTDKKGFCSFIANCIDSIKNIIPYFRPKEQVFQGKIKITDDMSWREQQKAFIHNLKLETNNKVHQIEKIKESFRKIITVVNSDPDLRREFDVMEKAYQFSLPKLDLSKRLNDETVEASRKAWLELDYWTDLKKLFEECLQINPEFKEKLYQKLNNL